jgi:hypothetical protein
MKMKKATLVFLALIVGLIFVGNAMAAGDEAAIKGQVDEIVVAVDGGKKVEDFADAANNKPAYVFITDGTGMLVVHPSAVGKSLAEIAKPVWAEVAKATPEGVWVEYVWKEKDKKTYVRKTKDGHIVGSGYNK